MSNSKLFKPFYVALAGAALTAGLTIACNSGGPGKSLDGIIFSTPTPTQVVVATATPTQYPVFTPTPYPTATQTPKPTATATATATAVPPSPTPPSSPTPQQPTAVPSTVTPIQPTATTVPPSPTATQAQTQTLDQIAQSIIDKYRNDTTTTITDYSQIQPIVDAVLKDSGLKYDNLTPQIWTTDKFNKWYCQNEQKCIESLNASPEQGGAFVTGRFVIIREGQFYQIITSALREILLGIALNNYNAKSEQSAEIAGNLGFSFANHTLAEKFGYDPHNNITDTPENRKRLTSTTFFGSEGPSLWARAAWLIQENRGKLDRNKPNVQLTAADALDSFKFFVNLPDTNKYVSDSVAKQNIQKDNAWLNTVLPFRLKKGKEPTAAAPLDPLILKDYLFYASQ